MQGAQAVPAKYDVERAAWRRFAPASKGFEVRVWDEAAILDLLQQREYAQWLPLYRQATRLISRADIGRIIILHRYGGMYADMDYRPLRDVEGFLQDVWRDAAATTSTAGTFKHVALAGRMKKAMVNNAFMATTPRNPLWTHYMLPLMQHMATPALQPWWARTLSRLFPDFRVTRETGPYLWTRLLRPPAKPLTAPPAGSKTAGPQAFAFPHSGNQPLLLLLYPATVLYPCRRIAPTASDLTQHLQRAVDTQAAFGYHAWDNSWVTSSFLPDLALGRVSAAHIIVLVVVLLLLLAGVLLLLQRRRRRARQRQHLRANPAWPLVKQHPTTADDAGGTFLQVQ